jgi:hypothetical protein
MVNCVQEERMRPASLITPVAVVLGLLALTLLPLSNAQESSPRTAAYLPLVFRADTTVTITTTPTMGLTPTTTSPPTVTPSPTVTQVPIPFINGDFEQGETGWTLNGEAIEIAEDSTQAHSGTRYTSFRGPSGVHTLGQLAQVPADRPYLEYWSATSGFLRNCASDVGEVRVNDMRVELVQEFCVALARPTYTRHVINLNAYAGQVVQLDFFIRFISPNSSYWRIDDVAFVAAP